MLARAVQYVNLLALFKIVHADSPSSKLASLAHRDPMLSGF